MIESWIWDKRPLSVSDGSVSSNKALGPNLVGPNAHTDLEAKISQSYFFSKNEET